jgi:hypothetical protein
MNLINQMVTSKSKSYIHCLPKMTFLFLYLLESHHTKSHMIVYEFDTLIDSYGSIINP